ncbi:MAG TPA: MucR family transcriptional regulator [Caulobacteraceae bacterium]|jgi:predicted transcriptional regulator
MVDEQEQGSAMKMATDIIVAYLGRHSLEATQLAPLVREIRAALLGGEAARRAAGEPRSLGEQLAEAELAGPDVEEQRPKPAVPIDQSITPDYLISLEDGQRYRTLRRHLMAKHKMTVEDYRQKWGLPVDYPMVAPNYARERSEVAKRIGLGHNKPARKTAKKR